MHNGYLQYPRRSALPGFGVYSQAFGDVKSLFLGYPEKGDLCSGCQLTTFLQQLLSPPRGTYSPESFLERQDAGSPFFQNRILKASIVRIAQYR